MQAFDVQKRSERKAEVRSAKKEEEEARAEKQREKELREYKGLMQVCGLGGGCGCTQVEAGRRGVLREHRGLLQRATRGLQQLWGLLGHPPPPASHLQEENMISNTEMREKYKTAEEYEDDFM